MKYLKYITATFLFALMAGMITSCGEDEVGFSFEELRNEGFDLIVVTDAKPYIPVAFKVSGAGLTAVNASVVDADGNVVASGSLNGIKSDDLTRVNFNIPFPTSDLAGSGMYTIAFSYKTENGEKDGEPYEVNIINNRLPSADCAYTSALPGGKNVWIRVFVPKGSSLDEADDDIYATGAMEGWTGGGNAPFKLTKIDDTCYEIALSLVNGQAFKITRGAWSKEMQTLSKSNYSDYSYNGESVINFTAYNWSDRPAEDYGLDIPEGAVASGMMTVVANVTNFDVDEGTYYVVEEGATSLDGAVEMIPFLALNSLAAAVPKVDGVNYVVVKDEASAEGTNAYGFAPEITWDGETNPVIVPIGSFGDPIDLPASLYMTGSATDGWAGGGSYPIPSIADGVYSATFTINGNSEYLLLPSPGGFDGKWGYGGSGNASSGTLSSPGTGGNLSTSGLTTGSYTITVDFTTGTGTYTLTANP